MNHLFLADLSFCANFDFKSALLNDFVFRDPSVVVEEERLDFNLVANFDFKFIFEGESVATGFLVEEGLLFMFLLVLMFL